MSSDLDEVIQEFLVESHENLDQLDRDLVELEGNPDSREVLASVFRTIHTIKGTCGFLGFGELERVAHVGENLLSRLRDGELTITAEITSALLSLVDAVREMLSAIETTGGEGPGEYSDLVELLTILHAGESEPLDAKRPAEAAQQPEVAQQANDEEHAGKVQDGVAEPDEEAVAEAHREPHPAPPPEPRAPAESDTKEQKDGRTGGIADTTIRVDVDLLEDLMNLVGELVLARNQIVQLTTSTEDSTLLAPSQRLNLITTELQERAMKTRMQPIGNVWSKFPRVVRDLAVAFDKRVRIEMDGEDTELDKTLIESIKDPLTHLVRNAVDHGIEDPQVRQLAGKPAEGRLQLRAFHESGQVNLEITDDGAGIDPDRLRAKAVERQLLSAAEAEALSDREAFRLIFKPGFSTAEKVTNVSGRGVGMDVVKTNIERIGGSVDIQSVIGHGTTFRIKIPLTLAIIPALVVTSGGDRYAIPQVNLLELVRVEADQVGSAIETIHGAPVYRLRGNLLPLVYLADEFGATTGDGEGAPAAQAVNLVVLQADDRQFGLVVEGVHDSAEIVVKPLSQHLKGISAFAGATIMGDGRVGLILDVLGLAQRANVVSETRERWLEGDVEHSDGVEDQESLLVFRTPDDGRMAIPLDAVDRLEEFKRSALEFTGDREVVQYRGEILPLVHMSAELPERRRRPRSEVGDHTGVDPTIHVVVHSDNGSRVGLVVDQILDIVSDRFSLEPAQRDLVLGTIVVNGRVTEVIDLPAVLEAAHAATRPLATLEA
jgi:two-component system chemotaxis sensor kinase CheA